MKDINMKKSTNIILNEKYDKNNKIFQKGVGNKIYLKNKILYDLSLCSGVLFLGHNHSNFKKSIKSYLKINSSIFSEPNIYSKKLAKNIKYFFPSFDKIIFCNTGSESVIKSLRISRAINAKELVVTVTGGWHGSVDQTLYYPNKNLRPKELSSGLKKTEKNNLVFIPYNNKKLSKKILDRLKKKINCLIFEPIMGSLPDKNSISYVKFIENYCKKK
jgi:Glutamate-1-semialdehyde aminotransferase